MTFAPTSVAALQDALAGAQSGGVRVGGAGTKAHDGGGAPPIDQFDRLDLRGLRGITSYNPAECVLTALAGTPVAEIDAALAAHHQYLPFDPTHVQAGGTIGGTVASGLSGSGRYRYGGVRDFIIGAHVVDGRGRLIATRGPVVENAAGFLTHHALVGSAGRLGAIADVTFKVFPRPPARATLRARCATPADAWTAHERLRATAMDLDALDLAIEADGSATVWTRLAGPADALAVRLARAQGLLAVASDLVTDGDDQRVWSGAAEFAWAHGATTIVKVPATPSRVLLVLEVLAPLGVCRVQCGGAVTLLATSLPAAAVHAALAGHAWRGAVVQGPDHGRLLGSAAPSGFADRVRLALDPDQRFH